MSINGIKKTHALKIFSTILSHHGIFFHRSFDLYPFVSLFMNAVFHGKTVWMSKNLFFTYPVMGFIIVAIG